LDENLYASFGAFPSNLPEMRSLYHLAVDVQTVVGGQPLGTLVRISTYSRSPLPETLQGDDEYYDITSKPRLIEISTEGYEIKRSCGLSCHCSIWAKVRKRKRIEEVGDEEGNEDDNEELIRLQQSKGADAPTSDDHIGSSILMECESFEVSGPLEMHAEDQRPLKDSPYAQEHSTMLLTYKRPSGITY